MQDQTEAFYFPLTPMLSFALFLLCSFSMIAVQLLVDLLICLHKPVEFGVSGEVAVAFYRVLFAFYQRHGHTKLGQMTYQ